MPPIPSPFDQPRAFLQALFQRAVEQALPERVIAAYLPPPPRGRTLVLGAGKAGGAMARAVDRLWPAEAPLSGLVVTRYGHAEPPHPADGARPRIEVVEASHPVPDQAGADAARRMLALAAGLTPDDLVLCLISGGGSALLSLPAALESGGSFSLADKQAVNQALLASGATIAEMNCVRKHLSAVKGGRLARACAPARMVTLTISDVPGDEPSVIASGPTVADATTCADALAIVGRYGIGLPAAVRQALEAGRLETPKPGDRVFDGHAVHLIATPWQSLQAAARLAREAGIAAHVLSDEIEGESREVGKVHGALARAVARRGQPFERPCVILSGGETTVTVEPRQPGQDQHPGQKKGRGGRAGEFCLGLVQALQAHEGIHALAADTDGIDGVEDNAGAFVAPDTLARAQAQGLGLDDHQRRHDAYGYFGALGDLLVTGPTRTNVNDFRAILVL